MVRYLEATANYLYGWGGDWLEDEKPIYTKRMRKTKIFIAGFTTFLTIVNVVADWYSFSFFALQTRHKIIEENSTVTDTVFILVITLCTVSTVLCFVELVAFVLQFKDARNYVTTKTRSELLEESVSYLLLIVENTFIPLTFAVGYFLGSCAVTAQIRSFPARISLVACGVNAIWRLVQSFAYCCHCKYDSCGFILCQWLRYIRSFFLIASPALVLLLLSVSLSLTTSVKIDDYMRTVEDGSHYSDTVNGAYLYQRFAAPYEIVRGEKEEECTFFESRIRIATPEVIKMVHKNTHYVKLPCDDVSEFYESLLRNKHRSLAVTYDCYITIGIKDSDFRAGRIINAGYELRDPYSSTCVSDHVNLEFDYLYDVMESHKIDLEFLFTNRTIRGLVNAFCDTSCTQTTPQYSGSILILNCSASPCANNANASRSDELGHISPLLVPERELMSLYPCMPQVLIDESFELPLCEKIRDESIRNVTSATLATCKDPYVKHVPKSVRREWIEEEKLT